MFTRFNEHIDNLGCLNIKPKLLLCVSGGLDSMVLASLMIKMKYPFGIAHVDHNTRNGASAQDRNFVKLFAEEQGLAFHETRIELEHEVGNFHDLAHKARYAFFSGLPYDLIFTAHHKDDVVESIFINFLNGRSLAGIVSHGQLVRPLLPFSKAELRTYAEANQVPYREDASNLESKYLRNLIRNEVQPLIEGRLPHHRAKLLGLAERAAEDQRLLQELINTTRDTVITKRKSSSIGVQVKLDFLRTISSTYVYHLLKEFGINRAQAADLRELCQGNLNKGKSIISSTHQMVIGESSLVISANDSESTVLSFKVSELPSEIQFNEYTFIVKKGAVLCNKPTAYELYLTESDMDKKLIVRHWKAGDKIKPIGMQGRSKSLKKIFADAKYDLIQKRQTPIVLIAHEIIWVSGLAVAETYRREVNGQDSSLIQITIS